MRVGPGSVGLLCLTLMLTFTVTQSSSSGGHCVWYDQCGHSPLTGGVSNCPYNGTAKPLLDPSAVAILTATCPELVEELGMDGNGTLSTCCASSQITALTTQMAIGIAMLQRCPACVRNFKQTFCYMTCDPNQSNYMTVAKTAPSKENASISVITELDFSMSEQFAEGVYDSCKDIIMPSTNEKVMSIMCGPWGSFYCNAERWFNYMGSTKNGYSPFHMKYSFSNETTDSDFSKDIIPCDEKPTKTSKACGCMDCQRACPMPPVPPPEPVTEFKIQLILAGVGMAVTVLWIAFMFYNIFDKRGNNGSCRELCYHYKCPGRIGHKITAGIQNFFIRWGTFVGTYPWFVMAVSLVVSAVLSMGMRSLIITTDPVELWASPNSESRIEKQYFDEHFVPFYRTEMLIIRPVGIGPVVQETPDGNKIWGPAFNKTFLEAVADLQNYIQDEIKGEDNTTLSDICFKPLSPANNFCTIQSVLNYFQNDASNLNLTTWDNELNYTINYLSHIDICFKNPTTLSDINLDLPCMGTYGGPVFPYTAVGGFLKNGSTDLGENPAYHEATALVITFVVNNHVNKNETAAAMAWEKSLLSFLSNYSHPLLDVAHSAERAIQDELERESQGDIYTILISYLLMFAYIVFSIGQLSGCSRLAVDSKVTLGLCGVIIVLVSVMMAVGVYGYIGIPATLIIIEVIPFLVLAVGVDNMFLLVSGVQKAEKLPTESRAQQLGRVLGDVAPALLISTGSEAACFFLGALSPMPAVRAFALYAGLALTIDFILQITCFLAVVSLDHARQESNRSDILCCIKIRTPPPSSKPDGLLTCFMRDHYGKLLSKPWVKALVIVVFAAWTMTSVPFIKSVEVGLDQELSMPEDSYLLKYFDYLGKYLSVGPPVYFVLKPGMEFAESMDEQNKVCGTVECGNESLVTELYLASRIANRTGIARPASSWLDDYISWSMFNMGEDDYSTPCCRTYDNGTFCPSTDEMSDCAVCDIKFSESGLRPTPESFNKYLPFFLQDIPSETCPKAGHAAYGSAISLIPDGNGSTDMKAGANYFMTYHTILRTSRDYYTALENAREIATNITRELNTNSPSNHSHVEVFPYSVFYVFYEQYLTIFSEAVASMFISIGTVFVVMLVFSGFDFYSSAIVAVGLFVLVINMMGCMYWFDVSLNAVSLVNLIMSVGIFVEFLSHMAFGFASVDHPDPNHRMVMALADTGTSVLSGITLTKIVGVSVLAFAHSQIFKVFYFRMYLFIIVLGAAHGLIWMPVVLSILGKLIPASSQHANSHNFIHISESFYSPTNIHEQANSNMPTDTGAILPQHQQDVHTSQQLSGVVDSTNNDTGVGVTASAFFDDDDGLRQRRQPISDAGVEGTLGVGDRFLLSDDVPATIGTNDADVTVSINGSNNASGYNAFA